MTTLQRKILDLLKIIDQECKKYGVDYYLTGGSLIGAIRHKGFIPWDDDADIIMTRDNWEKFYYSTKGNLPKGIEIRTLYDDDSLSATVNHLSDVRSTEIFRFHVTNPEITGILIDVLIMDPVPDTDETRNLYRTALSEVSEFLNLFYQQSIRMGLESRFEEYWERSKTEGRRTIIEEITKDAFHYKEEESQLYGQRYSSTPHFWPKEYYGKPQYVPFEDTYLPVPQRPGDCLSIGYDDDWFHIPRGGPAMTTHDFNVRSFTIPCEMILDDFEDHINREKMTEVFVERKKRWVKETKTRFNSEIELDQLSYAQAQLSCQKKMSQVDLDDMVRNGDFDGLEKVFADYIKVQCNGFVIGSSSIAGWRYWYHKCNPSFIDIGDDGLYALLCLLMHKQKLAWTGKLLRARESIDRPLTEELLKMKKLYGDIKNIVSSYECKEYDSLQKTLKEVWPEYKDNPFVYQYYVKMQLINGGASQELLELVQEGLDRFPDDAVLLSVKADILLDQDKNDQAIEIIRHVADYSDNGLVLTHMKEQIQDLTMSEESDELTSLLQELRRQLGEQFNRDDNDGDEESVGDEVPAIPGRNKDLNDLQKKRLELLEELTEICKEEDIDYYLGGRALLQAVLTGQYIDSNGEIEVQMTAENCRKFSKAVEKRNRSDRAVDSIKTMDDFPRFCLLYVNTDTLEYHAKQKVAPSGIGVRIEVLRRLSKKEYKNRFLRMLENGWESQFVTKQGDKKDIYSRRMIHFLSKLKGKKNLRSYIYEKLMKDPSDAKTDNYYYKDKTGNWHTFPSHWFSYKTTVKLEGISCSASKFYDHYLKRVYGENWNKKPINVSSFDPTRHIIDANIPAAEYVSYLEKNHIDREKIWDNWINSNKPYVRINDLSRKVNHYWEIMKASGERYRLAEYYLPIKSRMMDLYEENKDEELMQELADYYNAVLSFLKQGIALTFDSDYTKLVSYLLLKQGKRTLENTFRTLARKQKWKSVVLQRS